MNRKQIKRSMFIFFICIFAILCIDIFWQKELLLFEWDLFISGFLTLLVGVWLSAGITGKFEDTLTRLLDRGVFQVTEEELLELRIDIGDRARVWARRSSVLVALAILFAFLVAGGIVYWVNKVNLTILDVFAHIPLVILEVLGGYIAGNYLGKMALYGTFGWVLRNKGIPFIVQPGHLDGVAGLKPLGDYYFFQALITALPATFLAAWLLIMLFRLDETYSAWQKPYMGLLILAIAFEIFAFLAPMWYFHQEMQKQKMTLVKDADIMSKNITKLKTQLIDTQNATQYDLIKDQIAQMTRHYLDIESMPVWPIDTNMRRRFTLGNLALFSPLLGNLVERIIQELLN